MARVSTRTRSKGGHKTYTCTGCHEPVVVGEKFFTWSRRFGRSGMTYYKHVKCGYPRATELSSRKTAAVEDAIADAQNAIGDWSVNTEGTEAFFDADESSFEIDTGDLDGIMEDVATEAESVADEYEGSAENMPESLQYGQQAEAMRDVGERLREWADTVRDWASSANDRRGSAGARGRGR